MATEDIERQFDDVVEEVLSQQQELGPATDAVRIAFNDAVVKYNLSAASTLVLLARLAAACIHKLQKQFPDPTLKDDIEDMFNDSVANYLAYHDIDDVREKVNEMMREKMN